MRIVFMGTPEFSVPALEALVQAGHEVVAAYCQPPRRADRGQKERLTPVHRAAMQLGVPVRYPKTLRTPEAQKEFAALQADVAIVVAYGLILPQAVLDAPRHGCLNIHASLLPRWRGAAPIHRAILAGDAETGICIMQMEAGLDTGPVLMRSATPIGANETTGDLHDRLAGMGADLIAITLGRLGQITPEPQPEEGASYASKIDKAEARIDWTQDATQIDLQIRGLSPFPGAWTMLRGKRLKLLRSAVAAGQGAPGEVLEGFVIACGQGAVEITEAQIEGRGRQGANSFLNGTPLPPGTRLGE